MSKMAEAKTSAKKSDCVFCNIVNGLEDTELLLDDGVVCVFRDIKPATKFHFLVVPKEHIKDAKSLKLEHKALVQRLVQAGREVLIENHQDPEQARFGFHWPPCCTVNHLHLHAISPEADISWLGRLIFKPGSYWFVSPEYVIDNLSS